MLPSPQFNPRESCVTSDESPKPGQCPSSVLSSQTFLFYIAPIQTPPLSLVCRLVETSRPRTTQLTAALGEVWDSVTGFSSDSPPVNVVNHRNSRINMMMYGLFLTCGQKGYDKETC